MPKFEKKRFIPCILGVSSLILAGCSPQFGPLKNMKTNHLKPRYTQVMTPYGPKKVKVRAPAPRAPMPQFQRWVDYEPEYKLYPGDQIDVVVSSAPENSGTLTVGPDGRIVMPLTGSVMAAGKTFQQVQGELENQLAKQLRDPRVSIRARAYAPQQIFVGGEVTQQGTYALPGPTGVIESLMMAGGVLPTARTHHVAVLRRAPNGGMMLRTVNIGGGLKNIAAYNDVIQLRRGDIIFVPKTRMAEIGTWVQQFRNMMPFDYNFSYQFGNNNNGGTTVISP